MPNKCTFEKLCKAAENEKLISFRDESGTLWDYAEVFKGTSGNSLYVEWNCHDMWIAKDGIIEPQVTEIVIHQDSP